MQSALRVFVFLYLFIRIPCSCVTALEYLARSFSDHVFVVLGDSPSPHEAGEALFKWGQDSALLYTHTRVSLKRYLHRCPRTWPSFPLLLSYVPAVLLLRLSAFLSCCSLLSVLIYLPLPLNFAHLLASLFSVFSFCLLFCLPSCLYLYAYLPCWTVYMVICHPACLFLSAFLLVFHPVIVPINLLCILTVYMQV